MMRAFLIAVLVAAIALAVGLAYQWRLAQTLSADLEQSKKDLADAHYASGELAEKLDAAQGQIEDLKTLLTAREAEKESMGAQVQSLVSTVGSLDKLSKTDPELLEKYSSVYFLNENYVPRRLTEIPKEERARPEQTEYFVGDAIGHLNALVSAARADGADITVLSAYRSFETQAQLKGQYTMRYGAGTANAFSADQGYSEHQLGTTVDFTDRSLGAALSGFDKTKSYAWLLSHAHEYGFAISYPKGNAHFTFEPWHWRYVGVELAKKLHAENKYFYDLDQREIDTYLGKLFD